MEDFSKLLCIQIFPLELLPYVLVLCIMSITCLLLSFTTSLAIKGSLGSKKK